MSGATKKHAQTVRLCLIAESFKERNSIVELIAHRLNFGDVINNQLAISADPILNLDLRTGCLLYIRFLLAWLNKTVQTNDILRRPLQNPLKIPTRLQQRPQPPHILNLPMDPRVLPRSLPLWAALRFLGVMCQPAIAMLVFNVENCNDFDVVAFNPFHDRAVIRRVGK